MMVKKLISGCKWISSMDVHPSGDHLIVGSYDRRVVWFDLDLSSTPYKTLKYHTKVGQAISCAHVISTKRQQRAHLLIRGWIENLSSLTSYPSRNLGPLSLKRCIARKEVGLDALDGTSEETSVGKAWMAVRCSVHSLALHGTTMR